MKTITLKWGKIAICLLLLACSPCWADETGDEQVGEIVEVKGEFFKIKTANPADLQPGGSGVVETLIDSEMQEIEFVVSAVTKDYVVGQSTQGAPGVGDKVRFGAGEASPSGLLALDDSINETIDVEMSSGKTIAGVVLKEVKKDDAGAVRGFVAEMPDSKQTVHLSVVTIRKISMNNRVIYQAKQETPTTDSEVVMSAAKKSRREILAERKAALEAEKQRPAEERKQKFLELAKRNGVRMWPAITEESRAADIKKEKEFAEKVKVEFPTLALYETKYFLVFSNAAPNSIAGVASQLDVMHLMVSKMYQVEDPEQVYEGKLPVYIFANKEQFIYFEQKFMDNDDVGGAAGLCHYIGPRTLVSCAITTTPNGFAHLLVHESSHAEFWRYRSSVNPPRWFNEGLADYVGQKIVPQAPNVKASQKQSLEVLSRTGTLGGLLTGREIGFEEYGTSSLLIDFLIRTDGDKFVDLLDQLKAGVNFEEAIVQSYGATSAELTTAFGRQIGIPGLTP